MVMLVRWKTRADLPLEPAQIPENTAVIPISAGKCHYHFLDDAICMLFKHEQSTRSTFPDKTSDFDELLEILSRKLSALFDWYENRHQV